MVKNLTLIFVLVLAGCDGSIPGLDVSISMDAKQNFINAGGTTIRVNESNALQPVTVNATPERDANGALTGLISFPIGARCVQRWNVSTIEGFDMFWLGSETNSPHTWIVQYDNAEDQCVIRSCGGTYTATMQAQTGIVTIGCSAL